MERNPLDQLELTRERLQSQLGVNVTELNCAMKAGKPVFVGVCLGECFWKRSAGEAGDLMKDSSLPMWVCLFQSIENTNRTKRRTGKISLLELWFPFPLGAEAWDLDIYTRDTCLSGSLNISPELGVIELSLWFARSPR